jgi:hypothetical protein
MPGGGLDQTQRVDIPPGDGVLHLQLPCITVVVFLTRRWVADRLELTRWVISATQELFNQDEVVEVWPWICEATELPPWMETLSPAGTETHLLPHASCPLLKWPNIVDSEDQKDFEHFVGLDSCQGEDRGIV